MTWAVSTGIINKNEIDKFIDALGDPYVAERPPSWDQLKAAKEAAKAFAQIHPRPVCVGQFVRPCKRHRLAEDAGLWERQYQHHRFTVAHRRFAETKDSGGFQCRLKT
jgi:hypothetical protein